MTNIVDGVTVTGTSGGNTLTGTVAEDTLRGLGGNDTSMAAQARTCSTAELATTTWWAEPGPTRSSAEPEPTASSSLRWPTALPSARDVISDFSRADRDRISLSDIDANSIAGGDQKFAFIGTAAFSGVAGQLHYEHSGGNTLITGDVNGDAVADFVIQVAGLVSFTSGDFLL